MSVSVYLKLLKVYWHIKGFCSVYEYSHHSTSILIESNTIKLELCFFNLF